MPILMGYVHHENDASDEYINSGSYEINIAGTRYPAKASLRPMYDSQNERVRS
jgi:4-methylaminobutanoate oxidase (formaldehyde-forming)